MQESLKSIIQMFRSELYIIQRDSFSSGIIHMLFYMKKTENKSFPFSEDSY
jgi:hypothetical protein